MSKSRFFCGSSVLAVTLTLAMGVSSSWAQEAQDNSATVDEVISTGTFIRGVGEEAAIPVEVVGRDELLSQGSPSIEELARSFTEIGNVQSQSARGSNAQGYGVSTINMRNLGSGRTLLTMNGRRLADEPVSSGGDVNVTGGANQNLNSIPMAALQQVEILKGQGGATYGSDAVAGVVNFITRRDLNGTEASASYTYIPDTDGQYDASVLWGRRNDSGNVLLSFEYAHVSKLAARDRDWARRSFYISQNTALQSNMGSYQFQNPGTTFPIAAYAPPVLPANPTTAQTTLYNSRLATYNAALAFGGGINQYRGFTDPTNFPSIGRQVMGPNGFVLPGSIDSGFLRDDACLAMGGYRTWSGTPSPTCSSFFGDYENIADDQDRYVIFSDVNLDVTDRLRYHGEISFAKTSITIEDTANGAAVSAPCDPLPNNAPSGTSPTTGRNCSVVNLSTGGNAYSLPGYNPAVRNYVMSYYNNPGNGADGVRVLTDAQIAAITGQDIAGAYTAAALGGLGATGARVNQGYVPVGFGRMTLPTTLWAPFINSTNPAFPGGVHKTRNENVSFRTTQEIKGDLGEVFGSQIDYSAAATYSRIYSSRQGQIILTDRLQRALNGFATNLDNLGADGRGCTAAETSGARTNIPGAASVAGVPYTVGAGGGSGNADNGFDPGSSAGNGCYFFNPLSNGAYNSRTNGATPTATAFDVGFIGGPAVGGTAGNYQGYQEGYGLANAPGIVKWLYADRDVRSSSDNVQLDLVFNGSIAGFELPGGPIGWASGVQYRYVHRQAQTGGLADDRINPCPFLGNQTEGLTEVDNIISGSTCTTLGTPGVFSPGTSNFNGIGFRETVTRAAFAEFSLPILDNLNAQFAARYEEGRIPNRQEAVSATVLSGSVKYQVTPTFALRASAAETFDTPTIEQPGSNTTVAAGTNTIFTGITSTLTNNATEITSIVNTTLEPETGFNYEVGALFTTEDRSLQFNIGYFHNTVAGQPRTVNAALIGRALLGFTSLTATLNENDVINCADPIVASLFDPDTGGDVTKGIPLVSYINAAGDRLTGCRAGTRLTGLDFNDNGTVLDTVDYGLSMNVPNRVEAASTKVAGIESSVTYRLPNPIYDGVLVLNGDLTVNLLRRNDAYDIFGIPVVDAFDDTGTLSAGFAAQVNIWRGGLSATYLRGKHAFTLRTNYVGGYGDLGTSNQTNAAVPSPNTSNLNPPDPSLCGPSGDLTQSIVNNAPFPVPEGSFPQLEPLLTGANGQFNMACNITNGYGLDVRESITFGATWRYEMPRETTLTVSVNNLLDTAPPYLDYNYNYNGFGSIDAFGRTIKVAVTKKF